MSNFKQIMKRWFSMDVEVGEKYKVLIFVRGLLKLFAWVFLIGGAVISIGVLIFGGTPDAPRSSFIIILFFSLIEFMFLYVIAEFIRILINIENNTMKTARLLGAKEEK